MKKHLWQYLRTMSDQLEMMPLAGSDLTIRGYHPWTPNLWIDFLNADPESADSMWPVYKVFARAMEDLRDGMDRAGVQYNHAIKSMQLLSKEGFLAKYESLGEDARQLYHGIKQAVIGNNLDLVFVDGNSIDLVKSLGKIILDQRDSLGDRFLIQMARREAVLFILGDVKIPSWIATVRIITDLVAASTDATDHTRIQLILRNADADNFWLSNIVSGLVSSYTAGKVGRLCAAPDCDQFFIPSPHRPDQKYHLKNCQNRTFMRKARSTQQ